MENQIPEISSWAGVVITFLGLALYYMTSQVMQNRNNIKMTYELQQFALNQADKLNEKVNDYEKRLSFLTQELVEVHEKLERSITEKQQLEIVIHKLKDDIEGLKLNHDHEFTLRKSLEKDLKDVNERLIESENEKIRLEIELKNKEKIIESLNKEKTRLEIELEIEREKNKDGTDSSSSTTNDVGQTS